MQLKGEAISRNYQPLLRLLPAERHQEASKKQNVSKKMLKWLDQDSFSSQTG